MRAALLLLAMALPVTAFAQDASAPSLEARSDDLGRPWWAFGVSADAVGVAFGDYQLRVDVGLGRYHGIAVAPGWRRDGDHGPMLGLSYAVWPLGRGLHGLSIEATGQVAWMPQTDRVDLSFGGEVGYRYVWKALLLGASAGVQRRFRFAGQRTRKTLPVVRLLLGWAWN